MPKHGPLQKETKTDSRNAYDIFGEAGIQNLPLEKKRLQ
jgi:hypothetical protein